ncbi:MAG: ATP-binding cassette domain-containing protein [Planctomycetota bacterium]
MTVTLENVTIRYGTQTAVHDLSVTIARGAVGLLGRNGAGKSSVLKAMLGLVRPSSGKMTFLDLPAGADAAMVRAHVGYMPERDAHLPQATGFEMVALLGMLSGMPRRDAWRREHEMLYLVGLEEQRYRPVSGYSAGMRQKVKLAAALVHDPQIVFLDEPTNGLDPDGRRDMLRIVRQLSSDLKKSVLFSTHILQDVEAVCDAALVLEAGRAVAQGRLRELTGGGVRQHALLVEPAGLELLPHLQSVARVRAEGGRGGRGGGAAHGVVGGTGQHRRGVCRRSICRRRRAQSRTASSLARRSIPPGRAEGLARGPRCDDRRGRQMSGSLGYRPIAFTPVPKWRRWFPLARQEFLSLFQTKWGMALFFLCMFPAIGRLVMLLIPFGVVNFGPGLRTRLQSRGGSEPASLDPGRIEFYLEPVLVVMPGMVAVLLLSSTVVSRAIARDRMTNALELLWTRGISPAAYSLGRWWGSVLLLSLLTVAVPLALWVVAVFLAKDWSFLLDTAPQLCMALLGLFAVTCIWTGICILVSAACTAPNTATVVWCMLILGSSALGFVLAQTLSEPELRSCLSVWDAGGVLVRAIAGVPQRGVSVPGASLALGALLAGLAILAHRRLRLVEALA